MGRYLGPKHRISRRFAENIGGYTKTPLGRKPYRPGQHGASGKRRKPSTFAKALEEKQKLKALYNVREAPFRRLYRKANRMVGNTGESLLQLLECRLDNMVYRMGLAITPRASRQLVAHGHVMVNGKVVDRASYTVKPGQKVSIIERSRTHRQVLEAIEQFKDLVNYVARDEKEFTGTLLSLPARKDIPVQVEERHIVEFLSH